jgi:lysophospholipase L1-like esterase
MRTATVGMGRKAGIAIAVVCAVGMAAPVTSVASPGSPTSAIVSIGDSFISGEGGGHYGASGESGCDRSPTAPILSAPIMVGEKVNLACSGARTENVWRAVSGGRWHDGEPPQADQLASVARRDDVRLIVLAVGANDVGFGDLVAACALDWARSSEEDPIFCRDGAEADLEAALSAAERGLQKALREVRSVMVDAGYGRSDYRLEVMGYASPIPAGRWIRYPQWGWSRLTDGGCPLWNTDADWAQGVATPAIAAMMRRVAQGEEAEFLDIRHALDGHQLCDRRAVATGSSASSPFTGEWVRPLAFSNGGVRESLHPNALGQQAIGACIGLAYAVPPGNHACFGTPGRYIDGMGLEPLY